MNKFIILPSQEHKTRASYPLFRNRICLSTFFTARHRALHFDFRVSIIDPGCRLSRLVGSNSNHSPTYRVLYAVHGALRFDSLGFRRLVGSSGLEPPTSRLSGARSNHLSYEPMLVFGVSRSSHPYCLLDLFHTMPCLSSISAVGTADWWRWWESNPWPPACRAGALPAELHPHIEVI